jgi:lipid A 3-O-deacylase
LKHPRNPGNSYIEVRSLFSAAIPLLPLMIQGRTPRSHNGSRRLLAVVLGIAALFATPEAALGQARWRPRLRLDNDVYNFWQRHTRRPDEEYTNGVHASLESQSAPWWGSRFARGIADCAASTGTSTCRSTVVTLGQDLYTPHLDRTPYAVEQWELERPYFAWLFLSGAARVSSPGSLHTTTLALGVTGPPAGGELAQEIAHRIGFNEQADGWETQIGFEPGVILGYRRSELMVRRSAPRGFAYDVAPEVALSLGNISTRAEVGGSARLGWNLSHPWHPGLWRGRSSSEWWLSAGARAEYVARDMSLDGTWRRPTRQVDRMTDVYQYEFGAGVRVQAITVEYRAITRSREYRTGPAHHTYSSMIVSLTPP